MFCSNCGKNIGVSYSPAKIDPVSKKEYCEVCWTKRKAAEQNLSRSKAAEQTGNLPKETFVNSSGNIFSDKNRIKKIRLLREKVLRNSEKVIIGYEKVLQFGTSQNLILTDQRVIQFNEAGFLGNDVKSISYDDITTVYADTGLLNGSIAIETRGGFVLKYIAMNKKWPPKFKQIIEQMKQKPVQQVVVEDPLRILKLRLAKGELSKAEYEALSQLLKE